MKKNQLGNSELYISEIGFGCMSIGTEEQKGISLIHKAIDRGINYLDTADLYDFGKNEEIIGKALKGIRHEVVLATKVGNRWEENKDGWIWDPSKAYIKEQVKRSLRRLQTDYIDLYQLHGGTIQDPIDETIEAMEELQQEGWIRYYGISSIRPNVIHEYIQHSNIISVMMQYSILDRRPEEEILTLLEKNNISVIARGPIAKGMLSSDIKNKVFDGFLDYTKEEIMELSQHLTALTDAKRNNTHIALRYPLESKAVAAVIPGASRLEQLLDNVKAAEMDALTSDELSKIRQWSKQNVYSQHR